MDDTNIPTISGDDEISGHYSLEDSTDLADRLRFSFVEGADDHQIFLPFLSLSRILTKTRIEAHLKKQYGDLASQYADQIGPLYADEADVPKDRPFPMSLGEHTYLRIFAILVMIEKEGEVHRFLQHRVCDGDLPLTLDIRKNAVFRKGGDEDPLGCFRRFRPYQLESFDLLQWRFTTPFFHAPTDNNRIFYHDFHRRTILPWCRLDESGVGLEKLGRNIIQGAYATIKPIVIDKSSHDFDKVLQGVKSAAKSVFALKTLRVEDRYEYDNEVEGLQRFNGVGHRHIIQLMATFELHDRYHMILPWASCNLYDFWKSDPFPKTGKRDLDVIRWMSTQTLGLLSALDAIHNPQGAQFYGRHGDIKPENILWFEMDDEPHGLLVLADLGLTRFHRERSRSWTRNTNVMGYTVTYAPPELDIQDGFMSRSSDTWSFGCVLLEMVCWLVGGWDLCEVFSYARLTEDASGLLKTDKFFAITKGEDDVLHRFTVKPQVLDFIQRLDHHESCTNYVHDILDIIEKYMVVVQTNDVKRASTSELLEKFKAVDQRVQDDAKRDYIAKPTPGPRKTQTKALAIVEAHVVERKYTYSRDSRLRLTQRFADRSRQSQRQSIRIRQIDDAGLVNREPHLMMGRKKEFPPERLLNADKNSDLAAAQMIEAKVLDVLDDIFDDTLVKFLVRWQVPVCVQEELDGSTDLGPILTITGTSSNSLAICCREYVSETWKDNGTVFLEDLETFLAQKLPSIATQVPKEPTVNRPLFMSGDSEDTAVVLFKGSRTQISIFSQFLCWIVATFRLPEPKMTTSSSVSFLHVPSVKYNVYEFHISLEELKPLDHGTSGTCWTPLFPSTVMAEGFEVPVHPGVFGLQMPFDAMLELAEIVCDVSLEDDKGTATGIYLYGISFFLYPTSYKTHPGHQPVIQWHLKEKTLDDDGDRDPAIPPDRDGGPLWIRIPVYETLRTSITVLGYCDKALVQLGTESRRKYHNEPQYSHAEVERPNIEASLNSLTLGSSAGGAKAEGTIGFKMRKGHWRELEEKKELSYKQVLRISQNKPVIIYDTQRQNERAWMVSELSMILELFNIWAQQEGLRGIQYATASADGGAAAFNVLANRSYSERTAIEKMAAEDTSDIKISGIIKRLYGRIHKTRIINTGSDEGAPGTLSLGRCTIKGWDWLELVDGFERATSQRREVYASRIFGSQPCWLPFTKFIPVFFANEVGDLIVPEQPGQVCRQWSPLPGGRNSLYLAATESGKE
ncbi:serine threonine kinase [Fusarium tjaetaba]|uniref:Serine threonine kinase n=1 Tax=Fusarium tjaetaba TaxID=1567544 RepID=A0A8H5VVP4_9HYPO|nr:serine threonine kinase [Fusarium tjaetaba]KAF5637366.1 serine threonine kinase [Fusarium tjaetaba]